MLKNSQRNLQTSRAKNSRILGIKNAKFPGYCFYMNTICVIVPLEKHLEPMRSNRFYYFSTTIFNAMTEKLW